MSKSAILIELANHKQEGTADGCKYTSVYAFVPQYSH